MNEEEKAGYEWAKPLCESGEALSVGRLCSDPMNDFDKGALAYLEQYKAENK